jgi:hypothetical protein
MTSYRIASLAAASSTNALMSLLAYLPGMGAELVERRVTGRDRGAARGRPERRAMTSALGTRLPS